MNPITDTLHAGLSGVRLPVETFELGHGVLLKRAFAHFMAPFLMAFAPAEEGKPHPAPWSAVSDGINLDVHVELVVPSDFALEHFFDRLNTVWWLAALIRLRGASRAHVPVIADRSFSDIPANWREAKILPVEVLPRRLPAEQSITELSADDLGWLKKTWLQGGRLMDSSPTFNDAFQAVDAAGGLSSPAVALLAVWGALEHIFSPAKQELRFRVSANIAAYLEPPGESRLVLHRRTMRLYDARSTVAHGTRLKEDDAWTDTYGLARRILAKILERGTAPSREDLDSALFGAGPN